LIPDAFLKPHTVPKPQRIMRKKLGTFGSNM
jgi:hypothetical protein